jgi:protein-serine/threonine kinase
MAKMNPPLHQYHPERVIQMIPRMPPPRLEGGAWSNALREFVALCLNEVPNQRPTAEELQKSKFVRSARQPTSIMRELILRYEAWEKSGGVRVSMLYGAGSGNDNGADTVSDPAWDFDTVKSRISGVPKEWGMMSRETTVRPQRPMMSGPRPRGAERLYRLFETPGEEEPWDDPPLDFKRRGSGSYSAMAPGSGSGSGLNIISIPSFDDNGVMVSDDPSPSPIGMITMPTMPTDEEIMEMAREKAAAAAAAAAMRPPPPPPPPPPAPPSSTPPSALPTETPDITRTRPQRSDSAGASVLRPMDIDVPSSPRTIVRDTSPRRAPVAASAPSSPPRSGSQQSGLAAPATNGHRAHHLPSKSAPISAREGPTPPPVPSINGPQKPTARSAESTPAPPHLKSRSQDITVRQQRTPGKGPMQRPSHLNLNAPNSSNFEAAEGSKLPPSPSHAMHTPQQSLGSISVASSTSGANRPYPGAPPQQPKVGSLEFPVIAPLDASVLGPNASHQDLMRELDRMLGGMGDALEVVQVGLKRLQTERKQKVPEDVEE